MKISGNMQKGFTLIELLLATAMFSFILMFVSAGIIQVNRAYNKGLTVKEMHQDGRNIIDALSRAVLETENLNDIKLSSFSTSSTTPDRHTLCIEGRYQFVWIEGWVDHKSYTSNKEGYSMAKRLDNLNCSDIGLPTNEDIQIYTSDFVAVQDVNIIKDAPSNSVKIVIKLASNKPGLSPLSIPCDPTDSYCDFVSLETLVTLR